MSWWEPGSPAWPAPFAAPSRDSAWSSSRPPTGRVRTEIVDGYRLDRGLQVFNTAYPEAARLLDFEALRLCDSVPGAAVYREGRLHAVVNPLRQPGGLPGTLAAPLGSAFGKMAVGLASAISAALPDDGVAVARRIAGPNVDRTADRLARRLGLTSVDTAFLRPFLSGVLLDEDLSATSARFAALVWRTFVRGRIAVPALGMGEIPAQLAARLPIGTLRLNTLVCAVNGRGLCGAPYAQLDGGGRIEGRAVVVATDPVTAERLAPGSGTELSGMRALTTFWHRAPRPPLDKPLLVLDSEERLVVNSIVTSNASHYYLAHQPIDRPGALVATSVLGCRGEQTTERAVRRRLATLYNTATESWDVIAVHEIPRALPSFPPGRPLRKSVRLGPGLYVCGDHRDAPSIQGALVSGRRAADSVTADLRGQEVPPSSPRTMTCRGST